MSLNNFILECERTNRELTKNLNYYKNRSNRLLFENEQLKEQLKQKEDVISKAKELIQLKIIRYKNELDYMLSGSDLKEILEILYNKGSDNNEKN